MSDKISVIKASGEKAPFSAAKLRHSLEKAGASQDQVDSVLNEISDKLYDNMPTKKIYSLAFRLLKGSSRHLAAKYHLKSAIMELGPSGYPFEKYISEILRVQGYDTTVGVTVLGQCVAHEVDVVAVKNDIQILIECKYHNHPGIFCDVKVPLYIQSRFNDVVPTWKGQTSKIRHYEGWVVTNTRFSTDAIQYAKCCGIRLTGWDFPFRAGLKDQIDSLGLYPITCLTSLSAAEKRVLLDRKIVMCIELDNKVKLLESLGISPNRIDTILQEVHMLCKIYNESQSVPSDVKTK